MDELVGYLDDGLTVEKGTTVLVDFEAHARRDGHGHDDSANHDAHDSGHHDDEDDFVAAFVLARRPV